MAKSTGTKKSSSKKTTGRKKSTARKATTSRTPSRKKTTARAAQGSEVQQDSRDICFVISPFSTWHDRYYEEVYCPAVEEAGLQPARADDLFLPSAIVNDIWNYVTTAKAMLADLTGKNPNVFYELGLAHAVGKPVVLITQSLDDVPFDLRQLRVIPYDIRDPQWAEVLRKAITQYLREVLEAPEQAILTPFLREHPSNQPSVPEDEKRLLSLEREVASLRRRVRLSGVHDEGEIEPDEARALIKDLLARGMPDDMIVARVSRLGAPEVWAENQVRVMRGDQGRLLTS